MADERELQLREKIASQIAAISELPSLKSIVDETGLMSPETKARAQLIKELSDNEEQLELLLESRRVEAIISLQDELHPPENSCDCPICLETIKHVNNTRMKRLYCCGGWICCNQCSTERWANLKKEGFDTMLRDKCPLCREKMPRDEKRAGAIVLEHSKKGKVWAQVQIAMRGLNRRRAKDYGLSFDEEKWWKLIEQAADQGDSDALCMMSMHVAEEMNKMHYLKRAADLGIPQAQLNLAVVYDMNSENEKNLHYITLAASQVKAILHRAVYWEKCLYKMYAVLQHLSSLRNIILERI